MQYGPSTQQSNITDIHTNNNIDIVCASVSIVAIIRKLRIDRDTTTSKIQGEFRRFEEPSIETSKFSLLIVYRLSRSPFSFLRV
jgi:uncharacterized protein YsxB (DUF464 family)